MKHVKLGLRLRTRPNMSNGNNLKNVMDHIFGNDFTLHYTIIVIIIIMNYYIVSYSWHKVSPECKKRLELLSKKKAVPKPNIATPSYQHTPTPSSIIESCPAPQPSAVVTFHHDDPSARSQTVPVPVWSSCGRGAGHTFQPVQGKNRI